jgi:hypothetical protein
MKTALPEKMWVEVWAEAEAKVDGMEPEEASVVEAAVKEEAGDANRATKIL